VSRWPCGEEGRQGGQCWAGGWSSGCCSREWRLCRVSDLLKVLNKMELGVNCRVQVRRKCIWARWVYCIKVRRGIPVSASKTMWSPKTCKARARQKLRLVCNFLTSVVGGWKRGEQWGQWSGTKCWSHQSTSTQPPSFRPILWATSELHRFRSHELWKSRFHHQWSIPRAVIEFDSNTRSCVVTRVNAASGPWGKRQGSEHD